MKSNSYFAKVSFHGHSQYSDGLDPLHKLVETAYEEKIDFFGVSDHDTTKHIFPFYEEVEKINTLRGKLIVPIAAVEITFFQEGIPTDVILAKPGKDIKSFVEWCTNCCTERKKANISEIIIKTVKQFDAIVVFPHPEMRAACSVTIERLKELSALLPENIKRNVGIEVKNWSSNIFPQNNIRESKLQKIADQLGYAKFGLADYHCAADIKNQYSEALVEEVTPESLIKAIQERKIEPAASKKVNIFDIAKLASTLLRAYIKDSIKKKED